jgi:hypothetical protein
MLAGLRRGRDMHHVSTVCALDANQARRGRDRDDIRCAVYRNNASVQFQSQYDFYLIHEFTLGGEVWAEQRPNLLTSVRDLQGLGRPAC